MKNIYRLLVPLIIFIVLDEILYKFLGTESMLITLFILVPLLAVVIRDVPTNKTI